MGASASTGKHVSIMNKLAEAWRKFFHHHFKHQKATVEIEKAVKSGDANALVVANQEAGEAHKHREAAAHEISQHKTALTRKIGREQAEEADKVAQRAGEEAARNATAADGTATKPVDVTPQLQSALRMNVHFA